MELIQKLAKDLVVGDIVHFADLVDDVKKVTIFPEPCVEVRIDANTYGRGATFWYAGKESIQTGRKK